MAGRFLQSLGESIEPVIYACLRDYFRDPEERLRIVACLQMMSIGGMVVSPVCGGLISTVSGWRTSFWILAIIWGGLLLYAWNHMVESCPDQDEEQLRS